MRPGRGRVNVLWRWLGNIPPHGVRRSPAEGRRRRRRLRRPAGRGEARARARRHDAGRPPQLPPLPAADLPGGDRRAVARGGLLSAARDLQAAPQRARPAGGGHGLRPRRARGPPAAAASGGRGPDRARLRHADRRGRVALLLLRPRRLGARGARGEVARERAGDSRRGSSARSRPRSSSPTRSAGARGSRSSSSAPGRPASRWRARSPSWRATRCAATSARSTRARAGCCSWRSPTGCSRASRRRCRARPSARSSASASRRCSGARWSASTTHARHGRRRPTARPSRSRRGRSSGPPASPPPAWRRSSRELTGAELDRAGRITVEPDLTLPGHPEVLALGDMIRVRGARTASRGCPASRRSRCSRAATRRSVVRARLRGREPAPFHYRDKGNLATIGRARAVADLAWATRERLPRLGAVARRPPLVPDRLPEPAAGADPLVVQLRHARSRRAPDHEAERVTPEPARRMIAYFEAVARASR